VKLPDVEELLALRGVARSLAFRSPGTARALRLGGHRSSHRGRGMEFEEVRPYVVGDDPRSVDWRVTARRGRIHTKLFREERERPVWLLVDLDSRMFFGSRVQLKSAAAVRAAALLAWIAALKGDRVGAVVVNSTSIRVLPPRTREASVLTILNTLVDMQPRAPGTLGDALHRGLGTLAALAHPGSLVLALSDFATSQSSDDGLWSAVAAHSECRWLWISDALERQALPNGRFRAGWPQPLVSLDGAGVRTQWLNAWKERESRVTSTARALRIELVEIDTAQDAAERLAPSMRLPQAVA